MNMRPPGAFLVPLVVPVCRQSCCTSRWAERQGPAPPAAAAAAAHCRVATSLCCRAANGLSAAHDAGHASPHGHATSYAWGAGHGAHRAAGRAAADDARAAAAG